jgi:hypothetical protein
LEILADQVLAALTVALEAQEHLGKVLLAVQEILLDYPSAAAVAVEQARLEQMQ